MIGILYLSYDGMTDPLGQSQVIPYLEGLTRKGYHFHLISFEKQEAFRMYGEEVGKQLQLSGITWHPLTYTRYPPILSTLYDVVRLRRLSAQLVTRNKLRLIHCRSYITPLAGWWLKRRFNIPLIFDMRGFYADERVDGGLWNLKNPLFNIIYQFFKKKERRWIAGADAVISLTHKGKEIVDTYQLRTASQLPIQVIPCCVDMNHFDRNKIHSDEQDQFIEQLHLREACPVMTYLGAIGTWYLLEEMLRFFLVFLKTYPEAVLLFITHEKEDFIRKKVTESGVPQSAIRVFKASRQQVPLLLSLGRASLFFIKPVFSKKASSPTKQGEIMSMGIPLICNSGVGDTEDIVSNYGCGLLVDVEKPERYEEAVERFEWLLTIPSENITDAARECFSLESGVEKYATVYEHLLHTNSNA